MDCSPPGLSFHGISQARILKWVAISFSRGSPQPRDPTSISCDSCIGTRDSLALHHLGISTFKKNLMTYFFCNFVKPRKRGLALGANSEVTPGACPRPPVSLSQGGRLCRAAGSQVSSAPVPAPRNRPRSEPVVNGKALNCVRLFADVGYTVHGILQARMLEWVAFPFSSGSS